MGVRYKHIEDISKSETATVAHNQDQRLGRTVALKRPRKKLLVRAEIRASFIEQARFFAQANVPGVVAVHDFDMASCTVVLEKMKVDLSKTRASYVGNFDKIRHALRSTLVGLSWIHRQGRIHNRIELSHLMEDDVGNVKLTVAPCLVSPRGLPYPNQHARHIAPEVLNQHNFGQPGPHSDLYVLGHVMLELLVGPTYAQKVSLGIVSKDALDFQKWHAFPNENLRPIRELVPGIPKDLEELLGAMTKKQLSERLPDAQTALALLDQFQLSPSSQTQAAPQSSHFATAVEHIGSMPPPQFPQAVAKNTGKLALTIKPRYLQTIAIAGALLVSLGLVNSMWSAQEKVKSQSDDASLDSTLSQNELLLAEPTSTATADSGKSVKARRRGHSC